MSRISFVFAFVLLLGISPLYSQNPQMLEEAVLGSVEIKAEDKRIGIGLLVLNTEKNQMYLISSLSVFLENSSYTDGKKKYLSENVRLTPFYPKYHEFYMQKNLTSVSNQTLYEISLNVNLLSRQGRIIFKHGYDICAILISSDQSIDLAEENPGVGFYSKTGFIGSYHYAQYLPDLSRDTDIEKKGYRLPANEDLVNVSMNNLKSSAYSDKSEGIIYTNNAPSDDKLKCKPVFNVAQHPELGFTLFQFRGIENEESLIFDKSIIEPLIN